MLDHLLMFSEDVWRREITGSDEGTRDFLDSAVAWCEDLLEFLDAQIAAVDQGETGRVVTIRSCMEVTTASCRSAPSVPMFDVPSAGFEPATPALGERCSIP